MATAPLSIRPAGAATHREAVRDVPESLGRWLFTEAVIASLVGIILSEAVVRMVRTTLEFAFEPAARNAFARVAPPALMERMQRAVNADGGGGVPTTTVAVGVNEGGGGGHHACLRRHGGFRILLAIVEFAVLVFIAYTLARRASRLRLSSFFNRSG